MIKIEREKGKTSLEVKGTAPTLTAEICSGFKQLVEFLADEDKLMATATFKTMACCMADTAKMLVEDFNIPIFLLNDGDDEEDDEVEKFKEKVDDKDVMDKFVRTLSEDDISYLLDIISKFEDFDEEDD